MISNYKTIIIQQIATYIRLLFVFIGSFNIVQVQITIIGN